MSDIKKGVVKRETNDENKEKVDKQRTNHLLIIGIDDYKNDIAQLNNAVRDAKKFRDLLVDQYQFDSKNVTTLFNEEATLLNIRITFSKILNELTEADNLIFYYSGHGESRPYGKSDRGYWIPHDAILNVDATYLPNEEINNLFKNSHAHHVFGIVDSCYSGSLFHRNLENANERIRSFPSRWLLTAGRNELVSDGFEGGNSPFATTLLTYLKSYPNDSFWVADLCTHVLKGMDYTKEKQTPRGEPLQGSAHYGGQFVFYKKGVIPEPEVIKERPISDAIVPTRKLDESVSKAPTNLEELKFSLQELVPEDLEKALNEFKKYLSKDSSKRNEILLQQGSYNRNKKQQLQRLIRDDDAARTEARIRYALLSYIDDLEAEDVIF